MQNLLYFLYRYGYVILFVCLEILCFSFIVRFNPHQSQVFLKSSNKVSGWIYDNYSSVVQYFGLTRVALDLAQENAWLRKQQLRLNSELPTGAESYFDTSSQQQYDLTAVKVINNNINGLDNFFTLKGGSLVGLERGLGVINDDGVVGILTDVNNNYSRGISILNRDCRISVSVERNHFFGTLYWEGGNPQMAKMGDVPKHADLRVGDRIVTSGYSAIFPQGILVGVITDFSLSDGSNFYDIVIQLSNDMSSLDYVHVVMNLLAIDQLEIEGNRNESN